MGRKNLVTRKIAENTYAANFVAQAAANNSNQAMTAPAKFDSVGSPTKMSAFSPKPSGFEKASNSGLLNSVKNNPSQATTSKEKAA
jgi:hypothetical protein